MNFSFGATLYSVPEQYVEAPEDIDAQTIDVLVNAKFENGKIINLEVFIDDKDETDSLSQTVKDHLADKALYKALRQYTNGSRQCK